MALRKESGAGNERLRHFRKVSETSNKASFHNLQKYQASKSSLPSKLREQSEAAFPFTSPQHTPLSFWLCWVFHGCTCFALGVASGGHSVVAVHQLLAAVASLVAEHGLRGLTASVSVVRGLSSCSSWALGV